MLISNSTIWLSACVTGLVLAVGGCASIVKGTTQEITVNSNPDGADCTLTREGEPLGTVTTPGKVKVKRDVRAIRVDCTKQGHEDGRAYMSSRFETASAANIILGGRIGMIVDEASGASRRYDDAVQVSLVPLAAGHVAAASLSRRVEAAPFVPAPPMPATPAQPVVAAAAPPLPAGPFDGEYHGGLQLSRKATGNLRKIEVQVVGGIGTGTASQALCAGIGQVNLKVDPSGAVSGEIDVLANVSCDPLKGAVEGHVEGSRLLLSIRLNDGPVEFTLMRKGSGS